MPIRWKPGEVVIEITTNHNVDCLFKPLWKTLRGRWSAKNKIGNQSSPYNLSALPDLPGMMVVLNQAQRTLQTVDPLGFPEHKRTVDEANAILKKIPGQGEQRPAESTLRKQLTDNQIKTALWYMREMVDDDRAELVHGKLPEPKDIMAMDGRLEPRMRQVINPETGKPFQSKEAAEWEEEYMLANVPQKD